MVRNKDMILFVLSSLLLIASMAFINRVRGSGTGLVFPLTSIHTDLHIHSRVIASILFGVAISSYAYVNGILSEHSSNRLVYSGFDFSLAIMVGVGFLAWCCLGWGDYLDMGTYQRTNPDGHEVAFIDNILNWLATHFHNLFINRESWNPLKWDTLHARTDLVGMILRMSIMSIPIFIFFGWYFSNWSFVGLGLLMGIAGPIYFFWSKMNISGRLIGDFTGPAEWTTGALWGIIITYMFYLVKFYD